MLIFNGVMKSITCNTGLRRFNKAYNPKDCRQLCTHGSLLSKGSCIIRPCQPLVNPTSYIKNIKGRIGVKRSTPRQLPELGVQHHLSHNHIKSLETQHPGDEQLEPLYPYHQQSRLQGTVCSDSLKLFSMYWLLLCSSFGLNLVCSLSPFLDYVVRWYEWNVGVH